MQAFVVTRRDVAAGEILSIHSRNFEFTAIRSSYFPWMGHFFTHPDLTVALNDLCFVFRLLFV